MRIFPNGWCDEAAIRPSEHFNERPEGEEISLLVIHNISLPAGQFGTGDVDALFCGTLDCCKHPSYQDLEGLRVSSHFFIDRSGRLFQYVSCLDRAWHAGVSSYEGRENCNDFSIGVELEGTDSAPYEQAQYENARAPHRCTCRSLSYQIRHGPFHDRTASQDDPGPAFDWLTYESLCKTGKPLCFPYV